MVNTFGYPKRRVEGYMGGFTNEHDLNGSEGED